MIIGLLNAFFSSSVCFFYRLQGTYGSSRGGEQGCTWYAVRFGRPR
ncbi:conserved hypothetical protein [Treponema pallidum subsp. pallidum str. Chicago]|nr:conserved hypothetical protein [Treponema pallidum subsp. pallidum str. Chicago]